MNELAIIPTPDIEAVGELAKDSSATASLSVVTGIPGTGKTEALKAIQRRWTSLGMPGTALYVRAHHVKGYTRPVKDILEILGRKQTGANGTGSLQFSIRICRQELEKQQIRGLLIDEAENWGTEGISGVIGLYDACRQEKQPLTVIMASAANPSTWIDQSASGKSRALRVMSLKPLPIEMLIGVLRAWGGGLEQLAEGVGKGEADALKLATRLHRHLSGNFRRLAYFAGLHHLHCPGQAISADSLDRVLPKLTGA